MMRGVNLNTIISVNQCRQLIAGIAQFTLEKPDREWIYYDDIVGPDGYLRTHEHVFADHPSESFPLYRDGQEFVVNLNNGYKIIIWREAPFRDADKFYSFTQKPNGELHSRSSSRDEADAWPLYLEWKREHMPLKPPPND